MNHDLTPAPHDPPLPVRRAVQLSYVIAGLTLLSIGLVAASLDSVRSTATAAGYPTSTAVALTVAGAAIYGVVAGGLWVLFGYFTGRGRSWARICLLVLSGMTALSGLVSLLDLSVANLGRIAALVLAVLVFIFLLTAPARDYCASRGAPRGTSPGASRGTRSR